MRDVTVPGIWQVSWSKWQAYASLDMSSGGVCVLMCLRLRLRKGLEGCLGRLSEVLGGILGLLGVILRTGGVILGPKPFQEQNTS